MKVEEEEEERRGCRVKLNVFNLKKNDRQKLAKYT